MFGGTCYQSYYTYQLLTDVVHRRRKPFCEDPAAMKHPKRSRHPTASRVGFAQVCPVCKQEMQQPFQFWVVQHMDYTLMVGEETHR